MAAIQLPGGKVLPVRKLGAHDYLKKSIVLYGTSGTGKTDIIKSIMEELNCIDQVIVIAPTEPLNASYAGFVPKSVIHYSISTGDAKKSDKAKFLESIWARQEVLVSAYFEAMNIAVLSRLYEKIPSDKRSDTHLKRITEAKNSALEKNRKKYEYNEAQKNENEKTIKNNFEECLRIMYKKYLSENYSTLYKMKLSADEKFTLDNLNLNPHLLLIFDDCGAELKPYCNTEIFRKLFYQNRHAYITNIIACQDDADITPNLRKNAFVSFYTEPKVLQTNLLRGNTSKATKSYIEAISEHGFPNKITKVVYIRNDESKQHFYSFVTPTVKSFKFGCKELWDLNKEIESDTTTISASNPYASLFSKK